MERLTRTIREHGETYVNPKGEVFHAAGGWHRQPTVRAIAGVVKAVRPDAEFAAESEAGAEGQSVPEVARRAILNRVSGVAAVAGGVVLAPRRSLNHYPGVNSGDSSALVASIGRPNLLVVLVLFS